MSGYKQPKQIEYVSMLLEPEDRALMLAAPDLLEALKHAAEMLRGEATASTWASAPAFVRIRAAIRKTEGKSDE